MGEHSVNEGITPINAVAAGVGAALVLNEVGAVRNAIESDKPSDRRIHFEPAIHLHDAAGVGDLSDIGHVITDFDRGNLNANLWEDNPEVTKRLASYAPQVLAVDGIAPIPKGDHLDKVGMWIGLPGRPREINPVGFYVVSGDVAYADIGEDLRLLEGSADTDEVDQSNAFQNETTAEAANVNRILSRKTISTGATGFGMLIGAGILTTIAWNSRHSPQERQGAHAAAPEKSIMSRRNILKIGAAGAGLLATRGLWNINVGHELADGTMNAADAPTEANKNFWEEIDNYTSTIPQDIFADGRTALLIAKQEDTMDYLQDKEHPYIKPDAQGAIVMGTAHDYKSELFMKDKKARDKAIYTYAQHVIQIADKISFEHYHFSNEQRAQLTKHLLEYMSAVDITHVSDPGMPPGENTTDYVNDNVRHVDQIESKQVKEAIGRLTFEQALKMTGA